MELHTNFSISRRFGFFSVYDKEWPKWGTRRYSIILVLLQCVYSFRGEGVTVPRIYLKL